MGESHFNFTKNKITIKTNKFDAYIDKNILFSAVKWKRISNYIRLILQSMTNNKLIMWSSSRLYWF